MRFDEIGTPPQPMLTRWTSWLKAVTDYATNLPKVREIVKQLNCNGLLITRAQAILRSPNLAADLVKISRCYGSLVTIIPRSGKHLMT